MLSAENNRADEWADIGYVQATLGIGRSKAYRMAREGLIGAVRLGKLWRFHVPTLLAGLAQQSEAASQGEHPETASKWGVGGSR